jgi:chromosome partitioning protein
MPVIPIAIPKGGAGKTTTALVFALELAGLGRTVTVIDGDPNGHIVHWAALPGVPQNITVIGVKLEDIKRLHTPAILDQEVTKDTVIHQIKAAAARSAFVVVDLEGTANVTLGLAVSMADLVIIPVQGSQLDAKEAGHMIRLIQDQERLARRPIPYAVLMTRTNPAITPGSQKQVERTLAERAIPCLETQLYDREAYRALFSYGGTLPGLKDRGVRNVEAAQSNAHAVTAEILERLKTRQPQPGNAGRRLPPAPQLLDVRKATDDGRSAA